MSMTEDQALRKLTFLFEGHLKRLIGGTRPINLGLMRAPSLDKLESGYYSDILTAMMFNIWLCGHAQGVADQAFMSGELKL